MSGNHSRKKGEYYDILLVEEEPDDIAPFIDSFEATDATEAVHVVSDGDEALDFLYQHDPHAEAPHPDLILLDLHVSGTDGEKLLEELNQEPEIRLIPVLVFTASTAAEDIARSYTLNANAYLQKPATAEGFITLAKAIEDFWLKQAHLPPK